VVGLPPTTVADYVARAQRAGLGWPLPESVDDGELESRLFVLALRAPSRTLPEWAVVHHELRRKDMTMQLLWLEYKGRAPEGYQYSQFCRLYREWQRHLDVVMRQEHRAGAKLFVDFAGETVPIIDPMSGEVRQAEVSVAVLGASNYTMPRPSPRRSWGTGSAATSTPSSSWAAHPRSWSATT
jgi:transposase